MFKIQINIPPTERFSPRTIDFYKELVPAVEKVLEPLDVLRINEGEDEQTSESYRIYTGRSK